MSGFNKYKFGGRVDSELWLVREERKAFNYTMAMQMKSAGMNLNPSSAQIVNSQMQPQQQQWPIVNVQLRNDPIKVRPTSPLLKLTNNNNNRESLGYGQAKGLLNGPGQNNCFLNCAVQVSERNLIVEMEPRMYKDDVAW